MHSTIVVVADGPPAVLAAVEASQPVHQLAEFSDKTADHALCGVMIVDDQHIDGPR